MTDQRLYIDGELVDLGEDTKFTLSIKSNLFREISDIVSNNSYTIKLPKTVRNQRILGHSDLVQNGGGTFPYKYHTAQYFRNGVQLIRNGRAAVMSVGDDFEISIVWGLYPAFSELVDNDIALNELESDARLLWPSNITIDTYANAVTRGYFYALYDPFRKESGDEWYSHDYTLGKNTVTDYPLQIGAIHTGTETGVNISTTVDTSETDYLCVLAPFPPGSVMTVYDAIGGTDIRLFAILDSSGKVLSLADAAETNDEGEIISEPGSWRVTARPNSAYIVVNVYAPLSDTETISVRHDIDNAAIGTNFRQSKNYVFPSVSLQWLFGLIKAQEGVDFKWATEEQDFINKLVIPLINNEADETTFDGRTSGEFQTTTKLGVLDFTILSNSSLFEGNVGDRVDKLTAKSSTKINVLFQAEYSWDASKAVPTGQQTVIIDGEERTVDIYNYAMNYVVLRIRHQDTTQDPDEYIIGNEGFGLDTSDDLINGYFYHRLVAEGTIEVETNDTVEFEMQNDVGTLRSMWMSVGHFSFTIEQGDEVPRGAYFPIAKNLPEISITDLIKTLCALTGTFPLQIQNEHLVQFVRFDVIWENMAYAYDWTSRLIASTRENKPEEIEFKLEDYAQNNWYRWKEDETVMGDYDGNLKVTNGTLDKEREVIEFPFAATDQNNIPIYHYGEGLGGSFGGSQNRDASTSVNSSGYDSVEPRLMQLYSDDSGNAALKFDMDMQEIIAAKYKNLAATLSAAKVIKETFALSDIEIMEFDETRPVYLAQYGAYFAVTEIQVNEDGTSEVTMFQLVKVI